MRTILIVTFTLLLHTTMFAQSRESRVSSQQSEIFKKFWAKSDFDSALIVAKLTLDTIMQVNPSEQYHTAFWKGRIGVAFLAKGQNSFAFEYLNQAKAFFSRRENARTSDTLAVLCQNLGIFYSNTRQFEKSKAELFSATEILKNNETPRGRLIMSQVYSALTYTLAESGDHDALMLLKKEAVTFIENKIGEQSALIGNIYQNMGKSYFYKGMYPEAEAEFKAALKQYNKNEFNRRSSISEIANVLNNIGGMRYEMGDYEAAINYCSHAINFLDSMDFTPNAPEYLNAYGNIAHAFRGVGKLKKAEGYFLKMIEILDGKSDVLADVFATAYDGLGQTYIAMGNAWFDSACTIHRKGLPLVKERFRYKWQTAFMEFNIGKDYFMLNQYDLARIYLNAAIKTYRQAGGGKPVMISEAYRILAEMCISQSYWDEALQLLEEATLSLSDTTDSAQADYESRSWEAIFFTKSQVYFQKYKSRDRQSGDLTKAYDNLHSANEWLNRYRRNLSVYNPEILQNILAHTQLSEAILWEMYQNKPSETLAHEMFEIADQGKSRVLFEQFRFFSAIENSKLPIDSIKKINAEMNIWRGKIEALSDTTFTQKDMRIKHQSKLAELKNRRDALLEGDTHYAKMFCELPGVTCKQTQDLLAADQCLLEYVVADSAIYIFLLRKDKMLPPVVVKKDARFNVWHDTLLNVCRLPLSESIGEDSVRQRVAQFAEAAYELYDLLLDTLRPHLTKRVTVVRDAELNHLPFEVLIEKREGDFFDDLPYLLHKFVFSYENSAALYREVRIREIKPLNNRALVLAPFADWSYDKWLQLPRTAELIPNLCSLTKGCDTLLGTSATKPVLINAGPSYRFIHLSTHAKADDSQGHKSFILFRKPITNTSNPIPLDTLFAVEIFGLDFQAELISLNACETSYGELNKGEGIICIAWAFTGVGARSLVTTLWEAEADKAAPFVFNEFYGHLGKGIPRDVALSKAKLDFLRRRTGVYEPHPFYWAPFILTGETESVKKF